MIDTYVANDRSADATHPSPEEPVVGRRQALAGDAVTVAVEPVRVGRVGAEVRLRIRLGCEVDSVALRDRRNRIKHIGSPKTRGAVSDLPLLVEARLLEDCLAAVW